MPYIIQADRKQFEPAIQKLVQVITNNNSTKLKPGDLNYVISRIMWEAFQKNPSYTFGNELMGVVECVKQEFYRRMLAPYEDEKIKENGDL